VQPPAPAGHPSPRPPAEERARPARREQRQRAGGERRRVGHGRGQLDLGFRGVGPPFCLIRLGWWGLFRTDQSHVKRYFCEAKQSDGHCWCKWVHKWIDKWEPSRPMISGSPEHRPTRQRPKHKSGWYTKKHCIAQKKKTTANGGLRSFRDGDPMAQSA
jgi:hypothetical protein